MLADEFIRGAKEVGHEVSQFDAAFENVHPCIGCNKCEYGKNPCVFQDAMNKLNPMLLDSDVIVFATPIYYWNFPAQLKAVIDRFQVTVFSMRGKKAVLLTTAASKESWVKDALDMEFDNMLKFIGWEDAGRIYALGCSVRGEIENTNYPEQAYVLGKSLKQCGSVIETLLSEKLQGDFVLVLLDVHGDAGVPGDVQCCSPRFFVNTSSL